jgi:hypothetical protein
VGLARRTAAHPLARRITTLSRTAGMGRGP